jgi:hypothetical protein
VWILFLNGDGTVNQHQKIDDTDGGFGGVLDDLDEFGWNLVHMGDLGPGAPTPQALGVGAHHDDDGSDSRPDGRFHDIVRRKTDMDRPGR